MRQQEIERPMHAVSQPKVAHTLPEADENGDDLIRKLVSGR